MNIVLIKLFVEQNIKANVTSLIEELKDSYYDELKSIFCRTILVDEIEEIEEPIEYYLVSPELFSSLQKQGEATLKWKNLNIWGRTNCGQHIAHDNVIKNICCRIN